MTAVEQFFKDLVHLGYIEYPNENLLQDRLNLALEMEKEQRQKVDKLLDTLLVKNMCSHAGDKLIAQFYKENL